MRLRPSLITIDAGKKQVLGARSTFDRKRCKTFFIWVYK